MLEQADLLSDIDNPELPDDALEVINRASNVFELLKLYDDAKKITIINELKIKLHDISPLRNEPVDCVIWVPNSEVQANDYNPNSVAPPEM